MNTFLVFGVKYLLIKKVWHRLQSYKSRVSQKGYIISLLLLLLGGMQVNAEIQEVNLKGGERLLGEVLAASNAETLILRSEILGDLKLPRTAILSLKNLPTPKLVERTVESAAPKVTPKSKIEVVDKKVAQEVSPALAEGASIKEPKSGIFSSSLKGFRDFKTPSSWSGNLRFGMNLTEGSSQWKETYARGQLTIQPKESLNFYRFGASYSFRENQRADGTTYVSRDKFDASMTYRRNFSKGWFVQNALGYRFDQVKGIDYEIKDSIGLGYKFKLFKDKVEINIGGGLGLENFQAEETTDLRNGTNYIFNYFQELTWNWSKRTKFSQKFNYYRNLENGDLNNYVFSTALQSRLTDVFGLELSYRQDFDNEVGGKKKDDSQWRSAIVIYF
jgi:hypothetical protein